MANIEGCSVIDLFCGAGGLTHGFVKEGFKVLAGIDCDEACRYPYEANNNGAKFISADIEIVDPHELCKLYPQSHIKILVGCAPCQAYSQYTKKRRQHTKKWKLLEAFADIVEQVQPHIVSMENVTELINFSNGQVYNAFVNRLKNNGYYVTAFKVYCPSYGIPQKRYRLVLFASKFREIQMIEETHEPEQYRTVRQVINHLPPIAAGEVCPTDPLHRASGLTKINLERIKQSVPGGTWRDWDETLVAACHKKATGESYDSVYGRMLWDEPAPTITTQCDGYGNGRFGHPEQDRAMSMREAAIFQTFPVDYQFLNPSKKKHNIGTLARLIGNAVPVELGRAVARSIREHIGRTS